MIVRILTTLLALTFTLNNAQGADNDVERVRNPFVSKHDLGQLMNNQNAGRSFGRAIIPGFQRDSGFASNPSGCLSCTYGGGSRTFGVDHLTAPKASSTRRTYRKEQKFVNGKPVYNFHHERRYQDGQLIHEDRQERGEDDVGVSAQNAGFNEQRGLDRTSLQRNSQSSAFNNYQSSASDLNRYGSDGYNIPQTSSTRREFRKEQKFVNGQPVYEQHHERQFQDGRLVHEEKQERDENDFGVSTGNIGNIDQNRYSSTSRQSSSHSQSDNLGTLGDIGTDVNVDTSRLRQKLQEQMRTFRMKPRLSTVGTSEKSETRSESRFVNGQPVYERNEEQRYKDGNLVHSNVDEKGAADFGTSHLINSAAQGTYSNRGSDSYQGNSQSRQQINSAAHGRYATRGSGSYQGNSEGQQQYQQSGSGSQRYPNSGSQQRTYSAVEESQEQQRNTAYRPSYTPRGTSISTQQSNQQSSTSYRPSYTPSRTSVYNQETQRQDLSTNSGYRPRIVSTSNIDESQQVDTTSSVSSSYPGNRPTGSSNSNDRPYNRRTDSSYQTNNEETSQTSQVGQTYGSSSGSSYRPRGSSTTYREESQSQESATHSASRPSSSNVASSITVEGEDISHGSSNESPTISPIRIADGDKPAIYEDSYFARTNVDRRRGRNRNRSRGVYNGPRQVDLDLGETNGLNEHLITNGLNEHLIGTGLSNSQSSYDGSSQYSSGSSYDRSYGSSSHDSAYNRGSSASENNDNYDISTASSVNDNHIETEYDDHYDETDEDYGSYNEDYDYENTNSENSYYEDENMDRLNKERYDISPYDGVEDIPEVNNEVETSYNTQDSNSQPETTDYHNYEEEENYNRPDQHRPDQHRPDQHRPDQHRPEQHRPDQHRPDQHEQGNTGIPSYAYDNQDSDDRTWGGYPQTSEASTPSPYNPEPVPSVDHYQSSYDYSNNEVQQPSYPAVPHSGGYESSSTNYQESQEQSSSQYVPASSSSHSSSSTNEERRENIYDNGVYGPGVIITSPHTKTRRTELRTKKKYINGQLIGLTFYERVYENGELVKENITERGRDDLTQEELQQYGISMAEFDLPIYNEDGSYTQRQETTQKKKFVNGQQIYDLHHERKFEDGSLVHENRTEKDEDDFDVSGYNRHGSSGHAVSINTDTHQLAQGHHEEAQGYNTNQQALTGTVAHSTEDRQVTDQHIVNTIPHYTHRREEVRTQQKFVNGVPVYDLQHEKKYVDGQLVHENKTELNEDDFRIQYGHRDALQDILAGQTLSTARERNYGNYGNYGSTASEQTQSSGGSSGHSISGGTHKVVLDLGSAGHQSRSSNSNSASYDSSSTYGSSGYDTGSAGSESSTYGRGSHTGGGAALTSVIGLGTVGSGAQGGQSSYSSSNSESESRSTSVGGALDIGSSNLGSSNRANGEQQSSYGSSSSYEASQMGTSLLSGHSSAGSGGARVSTLDLGSSSQGLGDNLLGSSGHHSQSSSYESGSSQMGTSLLGGHSSAGSGGARVATLDLGASSLGLGSSGQQSQSSSYESSSSQMGTSLLGGHSSAGSGGARVATLDLGASSLGLGSSGQQSQSSSYESRSSQMGTSLLGGHSSAGSGGVRVATLDLGASSLGLGSSGQQSQSSSYESGSSQMGTSLLGGHSSAGSGGARVATLDLGASSLGLGGSSGHQSQSSSYESGSSYGSSSSSSGSSGCVSCVISSGGGFGASASGLQGAHTYSQGQEMSKEERYENGELVHGAESERDFENGQVVREQSRQYGGRNPQPSSAAARAGHSSSSSSYSSSSQSSSSNTGVCNNNPCGNGGTCIAGLRGALCVCTFGFKGKHCDVAYCPTRFCRYKGECSIEDGQHMCSCRDGHTGSRCATRSRRHSSKHRRRHASTP